MATSKNILPLLLLILLSLSTIFLLSLPPSNTKFQILPQFPTISTSNPGPNFTLLIKVLTFNRLSSLTRCLNSLAKAQYDGINEVHLHVFVDHFMQDSNYGSADLDQRLNLSKEILDFVDGFEWKFGENGSKPGGPVRIMNLHFFFVEDNLEVSPLYYRFLKAVILNYYYNASNFNNMIYGASLQRPRFVPGIYFCYFPFLGDFCFVTLICSCLEKVQIELISLQYNLICKHGTILFE
ncbi:uncharacterized protein LOC111411663 isoform X1 [Olea europaea subsp. europaea]|uniref:Uncharacterized protein LOC111411663 isoform X1 n=1 Tax=Olea europaea subsp. europaea TaxID=158383 RepID=A0A8S0TSR6_OLEEU|nr:uncharacterized protein LOC111411663 isoform X1 [Olea europaea subsp. europaea]